MIVCLVDILMLEYASLNIVQMKPNSIGLSTITRYLRGSSSDKSGRNYLGLSPMDCMPVFALL